MDVVRGTGVIVPSERMYKHGIWSGRIMKIAKACGNYCRSRGGRSRTNKILKRFISLCIDYSYSIRNFFVIGIVTSDEIPCDAYEGKGHS